MAGVTVELRHAVDGAPDLRGLRFRPPTVSDLIDNGAFRVETKSLDPKRRRLTHTRERLDIDRFTALAASMAAVDPDTFDGIDCRDLASIRAAVQALAGGDIARALEIANEMIFGLEWAPSEVERLTVDRLAYYYNTAVDRAKRKGG